MLFLFLYPSRILLLLFFQQLLLKLSILPLLDLHEFVPAYFFFSILEPLFVLLYVQCVLEVQLLLAIVHLCLQVAAHPVVLVPLQHVFQWEVVGRVRPIEEGPTPVLILRGQ